MRTDCYEQLTLWSIGKQQVTVDFTGGQIVSDAGLLGIRTLDKELGILAGLAALLPDPRAQNFVEHSKEALLTQQIYQILAGYPDCNDAKALRDDALFKTLVDVSPDGGQLASGSTMARFAQAYTRREAELPLEERPVLLEVDAAQTQRLNIANDYLVDLFIRTRRGVPARVTIDLDASDDPTHGQQVLSGFHGYYDQHQYFPLFAYDGDSGFPLAAWLRPGTVHASCGAVDTLRVIVDRLRTAWPNVQILVRGDNGLAVPAMYEYCEAQGLLYAFGYATNNVLSERTEPLLRDLEEYYHWYGRYEPEVQRFAAFEDYQAESWSRPRRIMAKIEINVHGNNRRYVVTNMASDPRNLYRGFYVQRGRVPEQPIGEMKNGLQADRLSFHRFRANSLKLMEHTIAYALVVLHREATAAIPEVATASVQTLRQNLWKVGALVQTSVRRIWFHVSTTWPWRLLFQRVLTAIHQFVAAVRQARLVVPEAPAVPLS